MNNIEVKLVTSTTNKTNFSKQKVIQTISTTEHCKQRSQKKKRTHFQIKSFRQQKTEIQSTSMSILGINMDFTNLYHVHNKSEQKLHENTKHYTK